MTHWSNCILEIYCMYDSMKDETMTTHEVISFNPYKTKKNKVMPNPLYCKADRPKWCVKKFGKKERTPEFKCFCNGKKDKRCPFFTFTEADEFEYELFYKILKAEGRE